MLNRSLGAASCHLLAKKKLFSKFTLKFLSYLKNNEMWCGFERKVNFLSMRDYLCVGGENNVNWRIRSYKEKIECLCEVGVLFHAKHSTFHTTRTYHPKSTCNHHSHLWFCHDFLAYIRDSFHSCIVDNNRSLWDTKPVASDFRTNTLDSPDVMPSNSLATYKWYCSLRIDTTYTIRPIDGHYATK